MLINIIKIICNIIIHYNDNLTVLILNEDENEKINSIIQMENEIQNKKEYLIQLENKIKSKQEFLSIENEKILTTIERKANFPIKINI